VGYVRLLSHHLDLRTASLTNTRKGRRSYMPFLEWVDYV